MQSLGSSKSLPDLEAGVLVLYLDSTLCGQRCKESTSKYFPNICAAAIMDSRLWWKWSKI